MNAHRTVAGFTLVELLVALLVAAVLVTGITRLALAAANGFRLQQALGDLQDAGRFASSRVYDEIRASGFHPQPWLDSENGRAIHNSTANATGPASDRIALRRWSQLNCFDNPNPERDTNGAPRYFLRETAFEIRDGRLAETCRYGPGPGQMVLQVNGLGLVDRVEAFQLQYAEDRDGDSLAERWVHAGQLTPGGRVVAVRFALLLASLPVAGDGSPTHWEVLDLAIPAPADGRLRRLFRADVLIAGRLS